MNKGYLGTWHTLISISVGCNACTLILGETPPRNSHKADLHPFLCVHHALQVRARSIFTVTKRLLLVTIQSNRGAS